MNICTIIAKNYLAQARVLARSFNEIHPDGNCTVLVIDDPTGYIDPAAEQFELLTLDDIGLPDADRMAAIYDVMELSTAVKPWLLRTLLDRPGYESVSYLDPDIQVFAPLTKIEEEAKAHGIVLTPHFTAPLPRDGRTPREEDILIAGTYNLGFIGLGAGETADELLTWWSERLENDCVNDPANGHFVDQRWIDLVPGFWPDLFLLRETTYNIAYWNLPTRNLEIDGDGYRVDGEPLRFFHFSGYDPRRPDDLSKHQTRVSLREDAALARICDAYGEALLAADYEATRKWPYGRDEAANGLKLDRVVRDLYREGSEAGRLSGDPFDAEGAAELTDYLTAPVHGSDGATINRYATTLWEQRQDLRVAFPDLDGQSASAYLDWMRDFGPETGASPDLLTGRSSADEGAPVGEVELEAEAGGLKPGVNVVGYISDERGVGEVSRQILAALEIRGIDAAPIDTPAEPGAIERVLKAVDDLDHPYDVNLLCVNADMLPAVATALGPRFFHGHRSAGVWFWEVSEFPEQWHGSFDYLDEVWVASEFIAEALRPVSPIPVKTIRVPVTPLPPAEMTREELGMPDGFTFLFIFDYRSVFRRKNPLGLVTAFKRAFEPGEGPSLVIKSIFSELFPDQRQKLVDAIADRPEIHLIEDNVSAAAKNAMVANCDCYVSLHRAEGLGLTMAEAMYFGKPVIATAYSGNLDFMDGENSFLVPAPPTKIGPGAAPYDPNAWWADPDIDFAAKLMRDVFTDPVAREQRARSGAAAIRLTHSPEAAADWIETRIAESRSDGVVSHLRRPGPVTRNPDWKQGMDHLLGFGGLPPVGDGGQARAQAKRAYNRALRPYAAYQHGINDAVGRSLEEVQAELEDIRTTLAAAIEGTAAREGRIAANEERLRVLSARQAVRADQMEERLERADDLVDAARTEPYMSDDRLGLHEVPVLGKTLGFRAGGKEGEGYRSFEDLFRGSEDMIRERQRVYIDVIGDREPVFDAGCGRGEFLDLLDGAGKAFIGVDLDPTMVERCREKGYDTVRLGDAVEVLEETEPGSLGAIFSAQVIEHMPFETLQRFLTLGRSRLKPGGLMIAETVNPHSARALKAFWVDPTHEHPLFPEVMLSLCETIGYVSGDVISPYGTGDWETDRTRDGEYAVIARAPELEQPAAPETTD